MKDATRWLEQTLLPEENDELLDFLTESEGLPDPEALLQELAKRSRMVMQRHFRETFSKEIASRTASYWQFPYTEASRALVAYNDNRFGNISDTEAADVLDPRTWNAFKAAHDRVLAHFGRVLDAIEGDTLTDARGIKPLNVSFGEDEDGRTVAIDIAPAVRALAAGEYYSTDIFGDFDPPLCCVSVEEDGYTYWAIPDEWPSGEFAIRRSGKGDYSLVLPDYEDGGEPYAIEYNPRAEWGFAYLVMCALVADLGCAKSVRACSYPQKRPRRPRNITSDTLRMPNDAVHKALLDKPDSEIAASQYWGEQIQIITGRKSSAVVTIINDCEFDAAMEAYKLGPIDRFWYEALVSLAYEGYSTIRGSDLLKFNGYKNPYQQSARQIMLQALNSVMKMNRVRVTIDTTDENRAYPGLLQSYGLRPVVDANIDIMRFEGDVFDFELTLHTDNDGTPLGALPIAVYSRDKKQLLAAKRGDMDFKTLKRLGDDQRRMWRYVMRRAREHKTSNTILFDTIFRNIGLEDMTRNKNYKMLRTLRKMLEEKQNDGALRFEWIREHDRDVKVIVTLTDGGE